MDSWMTDPTPSLRKASNKRLPARIQPPITTRMSQPQSHYGDGHHQAQRAAGRTAVTLAKMSSHIKIHITPADLNDLGRAILQAQHALDAASVNSALKNEDASHILARITLVDAKANALLVASDYLAHLSADLIRQVNELRDIVEPTDDTDL